MLLVLHVGQHGVEALGALLGLQHAEGAGELLVGTGMHVDEVDVVDEHLGQVLAVVAVGRFDAEVPAGTTRPGPGGFGEDLRQRGDEVLVGRTGPAGQLGPEDVDAAVQQQVKNAREWKS